MSETKMPTEASKKRKMCEIDEPFEPPTKCKMSENEPVEPPNTCTEPETEKPVDVFKNATMKDFEEIFEYVDSSAKATIHSALKEINTRNRYIGEWLLSHQFGLNAAMSKYISDEFEAALAPIGEEVKMVLEMCKELILNAIEEMYKQRGQARARQTLLGKFIGVMREIVLFEKCFGVWLG